MRDAWGLPTTTSEFAAPDGLDILSRFSGDRPRRAAREARSPWPLAIVGLALLGSLVALTRAQAQTPSTSTSAAAVPAGEPAGAPNRRAHRAGVQSLPALLTRMPEPRSAGVARARHGGASVPLARPEPPTSVRALPPPAAAEPRPGRYTLAVSSNGGADRSASLLVSKVDPGIFREEFDDAGGVNRIDEQRWDPSAVLVTNSVAGGQHCQWSPPAIWMSRDLRVGTNWHVQSDCTVTLKTGQPGTLTDNEDAKVVSSGYVDVGGRHLFVWAVRRMTAMTESDAGRHVVATANERSTDLFAPQLGLVVQTTAQTQSPTSTGDSATDYTIIRMLDTVPR